MVSEVPEDFTKIMNPNFTVRIISTLGEVASVFITYRPTYSLELIDHRDLGEDLRDLSVTRRTSMPQCIVKPRSQVHQVLILITNKP